jgi:hypothetical protein
MDGKIFLNSNLFPDGHKLTKFNWTARLIPNAGLYFDFDIESEIYSNDYNDDTKEEGSQIWDYKGMWANSGACWISSTTEWATGFLVGSSQELFSFDLLDQAKYQTDPIDKYWENEDRCFEAYILDHDYVGGHSIELKKQESGLYSVNWAGKIALLNSSDIEFDYDFLVEATDIKFDGIRFPEHLLIEEAKEELKKYVVDINQFKILSFHTDPRYLPEPRFVRNDQLA